MSDSLGLSIGMTNLVATRSGQPPVSRRAIVTLFDDRAPEVGLPSENPNIEGQGTVLAGFVERVGDPVPLVAADGTAHRGEELLAEALDSLVRESGSTPPSEITIAVPAHWSVSTVGALRGAIRAKPALAAATLIPDAAAALASLSNQPGLPNSGIVALCDFGGTGTSITLADAGAGLAPVGETVRYADFSGAQIDQALLTHVMDSAAEASDADPASTAAVSSLGRLRDSCRLAKERLSAETVTSVHTDLPGYSGDVRITRTELDNLIAPSLGALLAAVGDALQRNKRAVGNLSAVATVGGGAAIPVVTQRLSEQFRVPVVTTSTPAFVAAGGATLLAAQGPSIDDATGMAPASDPNDAPTGLATAAWAGGGATASMPTTSADPTSANALAWSQDDSTGGEPVAYDGDDYSVAPYDPGLTDARPQVNYAPAPEPDDAYAAPAPLPWFRRPAIIFGAAAAAAVLAVGGLAYTLTSATSSTDETTTTPGSGTETVAPTSGEQPTQEPPATVTITDSNGNTSTSVVPPPPITTTTAPTTTTTSPTTTTTTSTTTTTTTTSTTTTTTTPTTTTTTTRITTTSVVPPPTSSSILTGVTPPPIEPVDPVDPVEPDVPIVDPDAPA